jgi:DNA-binding NarL/FixJ family response regulator
LLESNPDFEIAGSVATVESALEMLSDCAVDVVLLDYDLGEERGLSFLHEAKLLHFTGRTLMVTAGMTDAESVGAFDHGASGIFLKHSPPAELIEAIYKVARGEMWLDSRAIRSVIAGATGRLDPERSSESLTPRERAVLKGVFEGLSNKEIAPRLGISESSVKAVLQQLFDKTGVRTRGQLVRIALEKHSHDWLRG